MQARLLDLLRGLVADYGLAAVIVTHDLAVALRNRERAEQAMARLGRVVTGFSAADVDLNIDNSGALDDTAHRLVQWLQMVAANAASSGVTSLSQPPAHEKPQRATRFE